MRVAIVTGSMRPERNMRPSTRRVFAIAKKQSDAEFELVATADCNLPILDEPLPPGLGQ
jgi:hypothetical protein